jgi:hypothetical protein
MGPILSGSRLRHPRREITALESVGKKRHNGQQLGLALER